MNTMMGSGVWQVWLVCGWQVKLCDPLVTQGPYLSTLEISSLHRKRYTNSAVYFTLLYKWWPVYIFHSCHQEIFTNCWNGMVPSPIWPIMFGGTLNLTQAVLEWYFCRLDMLNKLTPNWLLLHTHSQTVHIMCHTFFLQYCYSAFSSLTLTRLLRHLNNAPSPPSLSALIVKEHVHLQKTHWYCHHHQ